ncbi:MAG: IS481 family transposase [Anaerolineales bacterium]
MPPSVGLDLKLRCVRLIEEGHAVGEVAGLFDLSRKTVHKWLGRYRAMGVDGLAELSRRPHSSPNQLSRRAVQQILRLRRRDRRGPWHIAQQLDLSASSVYRTLCRHGMQNLRPKQHREVHRYEKAAPGELLHLDIKELVPLRRRTAPEQQFAVLDDYSREAFSQIYPEATTRAATDFLLRALRYYRYPVQAVLTDNALCFTMRHAYHPERTTLFAKTCDQLGIRHRLLRPRHPETNGKVERFFRTVGEECYETIHFRSSQHRAPALNDFIRYYNHRRPHFSLGGLTPVERRKQYFQLLPMS